ncbi:unnamed protein product [Closterium sp. NIES-64]|nr:unnamed protein product [Closterium sp. NIES-64]CAI5956921.1 unnamed protein product [Closterium sp. NIES-65]CAI6012216.1 unnamed protein product [Closterium sp. NIES-65]
MSAVTITQVKVLDNPGPFLSPLRLEISYDCIRPLEDDLEWSIVYVGSANDPAYDQVLESVLVGPVNVGSFRFILEADPPEVSKIAEGEILGVTVLLLTCAYRDQKFIQVGYYVNNEYVDEQLQQEPPPKVVFDKLSRNIWAEKPRVTKFAINWDPVGGSGYEGGSGCVGDAMMEDGDRGTGYGGEGEHRSFGIGSEPAPWVPAESVDAAAVEARDEAVTDAAVTEAVAGLSAGDGAGNLEVVSGAGSTKATEGAEATEVAAAEAAAVGRTEMDVASEPASGAGLESGSGEGAPAVDVTGGEGQDKGVCASDMQERDAEALFQGSLRVQESC